MGVLAKAQLVEEQNGGYQPGKGKETRDMRSETEECKEEKKEDKR